MLKKRLIFQLITDGESFYLSRNFRLNKVGNFDWLVKNLQIESLFEAVDEVSVINVKQKPIVSLIPVVEKLMESCFVPISLTGGLTNMQEVETAMDLGFEKLGFATAIQSDPDLIANVSSKFGRQAVMGHVDYRDQSNGSRMAYVEAGSKLVTDLDTFLDRVLLLPIGEMCLHSISREGTGSGYDVASLTRFVGASRLPITVSGGASRAAHFEEVVKLSGVTGMATANLLSFVSGGMNKCRTTLLDSGLPLSKLQVFFGRESSG